MACLLPPLAAGSQNLWEIRMQTLHLPREADIVVDLEADTVTIGLGTHELEMELADFADFVEAMLAVVDEIGDALGLPDGDDDGDEPHTLN